MAILYTLQLKDGTTYDLDNQTFQILEEESNFEVDLIERSAGPGSIFPGIKRDKSNELEFSYKIIRDNDIDFRSIENEYRLKFREAEYLINNNVNLRTKIEVKQHKLSYLEGTERRYNEGTVTFTQLTPYWEELTETSDSDSGSDITFTINNNGFLKTEPIIVLTTSSAVSKFYIYIDSTLRGLAVKDLQFGTGSLTTYTIDCDNGTIDLSGYNRENLIRLGTGYFSIPIGSSDLKIITSASVSATIYYRKRYYL